LTQGVMACCITYSRCNVRTLAGRVGHDSNNCGGGGVFAPLQVAWRPQDTLQEHGGSRRINRMFEPIRLNEPKSPTGPGTEGDGAVVVDKEELAVEPPKLYQVVMLNDDFTPMEFVVFVLQEHFRHDLETATQIMLKIHHEGRGVCGVFTKDVAATKVELVLAAARRAGHPLQCILETA